MKLYPAIDLLNGRCVRLTKGLEHTAVKYSESPVEVIKAFAAQGAEAIHIVNLSSAFNTKNHSDDLLRAMRRAVDTPLQLGGGIRSLGAAERYLSMGFDIVLGSWLLDENAPIKTLTQKYGHRIIAAIDCKENKMTSHGWTAHSDRTASDMVEQIKKQGFTKMIYTDIDKDGTLSGPNLSALLAIQLQFEGELIASGGVGTLMDIRALKSAGILSCIIGKALYENKFTLKAALEVAHVNQTHYSMP